MPDFRDTIPTKITLLHHFAANHTATGRIYLPTMPRIALISRAIGCIALATPLTAQPAPSLLPGGAESWKLFWSDEFDYPDTRLEEKWQSQNSASTHILSSRWRENALVKDGTLKLINRKESRGGNDWTSGNVWTKQQFQYGYFECRYRYAAAEGTNNSFWLMTQGKVPQGKKAFEIDINEGHFPNEINTNIHNWSDVTVVNGKRPISASRSFPFGLTPEVSLQLEIPIKTQRIRLTSTNASHFHLGEFRLYSVSPKGYPRAGSNTADKDQPGLVNFVREKGTASPPAAPTPPKETVLARRGWRCRQTLDHPDQGREVDRIHLAGEREIGCLQFVQGWLDKKTWRGMMERYLIEYHDGQRWVTITQFDATTGQHNFARDFHTYGLEWSQKELVFYFNGREIRREKNEFCHSPAPIWLSLAIIPWGGKITDAIHGTFMEIDYVRVYQRK